MWIEALPIDNNMSPSITMLFEEDLLSERGPRPEETNLDLGGPPASQSMIPNLTPDSTEVNLILAGKLMVPNLTLDSTLPRILPYPRFYRG
jgi:hypothetical protein